MPQQLTNPRDYPLGTGRAEPRRSAARECAKLTLSAPRVKLCAYCLSCPFGGGVRSQANTERHPRFRPWHHAPWNPSSAACTSGSSKLARLLITARADKEGPKDPRLIKASADTAHDLLQKDEAKAHDLLQTGPWPLDPRKATM